VHIDVSQNCTINSQKQYLAIKTIALEFRF